MKPFQAPLEDILFSLNHIARATELPDWDPELASSIGKHFAVFAEAEFAPLDEPGDIQGCVVKDDRVYMPDGFAEAYKSYAEQGWQSLTMPEKFGGQGVGALVSAITSEIFSGANHSLQMVTGLAPGAVRTLLNFGNAEQKSRFIPSLASGEALATMCLTEPGAGSDLSRVTCKARPNRNGWTISGEKIFISGGDQNLSERIYHLVLARTSSGGVKGLSLFLCPCTRPDGTRNGVFVTRIEEKMGLHASPTCQLTFEEAEAELLGSEGRGLQAMFTMMNHARLDVALQGVAHAARAHDIAETYASQRVQGRGESGNPVTLSQHTDVRRMLDEIDWLALSSRSLAHLAYVNLEHGESPDLVEFLTPVAKVYCTEAGIKASELGIQVLGGYGYLREYRLEQTYRDARVTSIYEGTNGIHARMLATRLAPAAAGDAFAEFVALENEGNSSCEISHALDDWQSARTRLVKSDGVALANEFMQATISTVLLCIRNRIRRAASQHSQPERITRVCDRTVKSTV
ncbi:acyl-CoA dehydrogenase family protein [Ruegeria arenilitoris]|uniref:acyl-CoA dehydrogenase family protein n=1 Tax=Ruegeria arenilitoris TaxID=1173585 RepID=UPI00147EE3D8|nr:acyl-CoA dehydrogenase family protein [Ruegeria arenilitoris]